MPHLISAEKAALEIRRGLESDKFEIAIPKAFVWRMKLLQMMPYRLYFYLARKMLEKHENNQ